jgi:hypothetical protein
MNSLISSRAADPDEVGGGVLCAGAVGGVPSWSDTSTSKGLSPSRRLISRDGDETRAAKLETRAAPGTMSRRRA